MIVIDVMEIVKEVMDLVIKEKAVIHLIDVMSMLMDIVIGMKP